MDIVVNDLRSVGVRRWRLKAAVNEKFMIGSETEVLHRP